MTILKIDNAKTLTDLLINNERIAHHDILLIIIIIIFITYTPGTNKHTHEKNKNI